MFTDKKYPIKQKKITFTLKYKNDEKLEKNKFSIIQFYIVNLCITSIMKFKSFIYTKSLNMLIDQNYLFFCKHQELLHFLQHKMTALGV